MKDDPVVLALEAALGKGDSVDVRIALAEHLLKKGAFPEALQHFEKALVLDPENAVVLRGAAEAAEAAGDHDRASAYRVACAAMAGHDAKSPSASEAQAPSSVSPKTAVAKDGSEFSGGPPVKKRDEEKDESLTESSVPSIRVVARNGKILEEHLKTVTFRDVAGLDEIKTKLNRAFILPVRNPAMQKKFGKKISGGLILYGPPGCGKTFLARAMAGEVGARFINISLFDVLDMWFGESEKKIHELFENARRMAPTVLFFDEIDALGQKRSHLKGSAGRTLVNQLLSEMDGYGAGKEGVFFLAATNHPWDVDTALRRTGRFDRLVFIPPPDQEAREAIFKLKIQGRPVMENIDFSLLAKRTEGFSGADIESLVERATELAIEESIEKGRDQKIDQNHLEISLKDMRPTALPWLELARNYAVYANEAGTFDDLLRYLTRIGLA